MADGDKLILGTDFNEENTTTELTKRVGFLPVLDLFNDNGVGLLSIGGQSIFHGNVVSKGEAVAAFSPGVGVYATGDDGGVLAVGRVGVDAISEIGGVGVRGTATTGRGVVGSSAFGPGVEANSASGPGVLGTSGSGHGVNGLSRTRAGVVGTSINFIGTAGVAIERGIGVVGIGLQGLAGAFWGDVVVLGDFTVVGGAKSAAVKSPDGFFRRLYALESPESWLEDFASAKLSKGKCQVKLERNFASVIRADSYHVFLTPKGDSNGLFVSRQTRNGFEVKEQGGGTSNIEFSYRVVAKRKDIAGKRMEKVKLPAMPSMETKAKKLAPLPEVPKPRPLSQYRKG
jgi:hypothetical protein